MKNFDKKIFRNLQKFMNDNKRKLIEYYFPTGSKLLMLIIFRKFHIRIKEES